MTSLPVEAGREINSALDKLRAATANLVVTNHEQYEQAAQMRREIKTVIKMIKEHLDPVCETAHKTWQTTVQLRNDMIKPFEECDKTIREKQELWLRAERERAEAEERRIAEEARRAAEEEKLRVAAALESAGNTRAADAVLDEPINVVAPVLMMRPKNTREIWKARVVAKLALVRHVAENPELLNLIEINQRMLDALAARQKTLLALPGVEAVCELVVINR